MKVVNCIHQLAAIAAKKGFQPVMETTELEQTQLTTQAKQELELQMVNQNQINPLSRFTTQKKLISQ